jgi:hypothetical protein
LFRNSIITTISKNALDTPSLPVPADVASIAALHIAASSPSTLYQLQWGGVPAATMLSLVEQGIARRINRALEPGPALAFWVVRDEDLDSGVGGRLGEEKGKGEVVAYIEWDFPKAISELEEDGKGDDGNPAVEEVATPQLKKHANLPEGTNVVLLNVFQEKINTLRKEVIADQSYYCNWPQFRDVLEQG